MLIPWRVFPEGGDTFLRVGVTVYFFSPCLNWQLRESFCSKKKPLRKGFLDQIQVKVLFFLVHSKNGQKSCVFIQLSPHFLLFWGG